MMKKILFSLVMIMPSVACSMDGWKLVFSTSRMLLGAVGASRVQDIADQALHPELKPLTVFDSAQTQAARSAARHNVTHGVDRTLIGDEKSLCSVVSHTDKSGAKGSVVDHALATGDKVIGPDEEVTKFLREG